MLRAELGESSWLARHRHGVAPRAGPPTGAWYTGRGAGEVLVGARLAGDGFGHPFLVAVGSRGAVGARGALLRPEARNCWRKKTTVIPHFQFLLENF